MYEFLIKIFENLPTYEDVTMGYILSIVLAGAVGGFVGAIVHQMFKGEAFLLLPRKMKHEIKLGILAPVFVGCYVGLLVDRSFINASFSAFIVISSPYWYEFLKYKLKYKLKSWLNND